jgi:hypothetical protein
MKNIFLVVLFLLLFVNNVFALPTDTAPGNDDLTRVLSGIKYNLGGNLKDEMGRVSEDDILANHLKAARHFYGLGYLGHFQSAEDQAKEPYTDEMENYYIEEIAPGLSNRPLEEIGYILHLLEDMINHSHRK